MKKLLVVSAVAGLSAFGAFAAEDVIDTREPIVAYWTGAENGFWTNANNWAEGVVPGSTVQVDEDGETYVNVWKGCTAVFTNRTFTLNGKEYKVNTDNYKVRYIGMRSIGRIVVAGEDTGTYEFVHGGWGVGDTYSFEDPLYVEPNGGITIAENVTRNIAFNIVMPGGPNDTVEGDGAVFRNDSSCELSYYCMGQYAKWDHTQIAVYHIFEGSGNQRFKGWRQNNYWPRFRMMQNGGRVIWDNGNTDLWIERFEIPAGAGKQTFQITEGSRLGQSGWQDNNYITAKDDFDILGPGRILYGSGYRMGMSIVPGKRIYVTASLQNAGKGIGVYGGGRVILDCTNVLAEAVQVWGDTTLEIPRKIGMCGEDSPLSPGSNGVTFNGNGTLDYTGPGETTDRPIVLTSGATATLKNNGAARLTWAGAISGSGAIAFADSAQEFVLSGDVAALPVVVDAGANGVFGKPSDVDSKAYSLETLTVAGNGVLTVADGVTVTFASLARTGGTFDVKTEGTGRIKVSSETSKFAPEWLLLNGKPSRFGADGVLMGADEPDVSIDAKGGVIPDGATQIVGIMTAEGEGEGVTLEKTETAVQALLQGQSVQPATVTVGAGEKLTAEALVVKDGAAALAFEGTGTLETKDVRGAVTVADAATVKVTDQTGTGELRIESDRKPTLDFRVNSGKLTISGGETGNEAVLRNGKVFNNGELTIDGANLAQEGFDPKTYAASVVDITQDLPSLEVGSTNGIGILKLKSGSYMGVLFASHGARTAKNLSAVYQTGGTNVFAGHPEGSENKSLGAYGYNYYELKGGLLNPIGDYYISPDSGVGVMAILGGEYRQGGSITAGTRGGRIRLGAYTSYAHLLVRNALFDYSKAYYNMLMPGYGRDCTDAVFTIEDGAEVDFGLCAIDWGYGFASGGKSCYSVINFNGGVYKGISIRRGLGYIPVSQGGTGTDERYTNTFCFANFNGGTYRAKNNDTLFGADLCVPSRLTVYEKGGTIDDGGFWVTLHAPFSSPSGKGLKSVPLPPAVANASLIGSPYVYIDGDGRGATAYADFDSASGKVTGVHVTSPGNDYTWAKAKFYYVTDGSTKTLLGEADCEVGVCAPGNLTLTGTKVVVLKNSSPDFRGEIVVQTSVNLGDYAEFPNATISLDGGSLAVATNSLAKSLRTTANGGSVLPRYAGDGCNLTFAGYTADLADALAGNMPVVGVNVAFSAPITLKNLDMIEANPGVRRYRFAQFTSIVGDPPTVSAETPVPDGWKFVVSPTGVLTLKKDLGSLILVR